jgi:hypothetical protein
MDRAVVRAVFGFFAGVLIIGGTVAHIYYGQDVQQCGSDLVAAAGSRYAGACTRAYIGDYSGQALVGLGLAFVVGCFIVTLAIPARAKPPPR